MRIAKDKYVEDSVHFSFLGYEYDYPTIRPVKKSDAEKNIKTVKLTKKLKNKVIDKIKEYIKECDKIVEFYESKEKIEGYKPNDRKACSVCEFFRGYLVVHIEHLKGLK